MTVKIKFRILQSNKVVAEGMGVADLVILDNPGALHTVIATEQGFEQLTGLRLHLEGMEEPANEEIEDVRRQLEQTAKEVIKEYLEWGPMTGSDRDLFERKFRKVLGEKEK
jgi:hypothetical protein